MKNPTILVLLFLTSLPLALSAQPSDCYLTNWKALTRTYIPKTTPLYSQTLKIEKNVLVNGVQYRQFHYISLCSTMDYGINGSANYIVTTFKEGGEIISTKGVKTQDFLLDHLSFYPQIDSKDPFTTKFTLQIAPDYKKLTQTYRVFWALAGYSNITEFILFNTDFVIENLFLGTSIGQSFFSFSTGILILILSLFPSAERKEDKATLIDIPTGLAGGLIAAVICNYIIQKTWMSSIGIYLVIGIPILTALVSSILFARSEMSSNFVKICSVIVCLTQCIGYLSFKNETFCYTYSGCFLAFILFQLFFSFKDSKIEWLLSCAYSVQIMYRIASVFFQNPLYESYQIINVEQFYTMTDNMNKGAWVFMFLAPALAIFRTNIIDGLQRKKRILSEFIPEDNFYKSEATLQANSLQD